MSSNGDEWLPRAGLVALARQGARKFPAAGPPHVGEHGLDRHATGGWRRAGRLPLPRVRVHHHRRRLGSCADVQRIEGRDQRAAEDSLDGGAPAPLTWLCRRPTPADRRPGVRRPFILPEQRPAAATRAMLPAAAATRHARMTPAGSLPDPDHRAALARSVVVRAAARPSRRSPGQTALNFNRSLRRPSGEGRSPSPRIPGASWHS
jgi:hypothetical protein